MLLNNHHILIVSNEPWGSMWYSKHHYALELSKKNQVYFLNPASRWNISALSGTCIRSTPLSGSLTLLDYQNRFPLTGSSDAAFFHNEKWLYKELNAFFKKRNIDDLICWTFDPYRLINPSQCSAVLTIYHSMDYYTNPRERLLLPHADIILAPADAILDKYKEASARRYKIPHGVTESGYSEEARRSTRVKNELIFAGTINYRLDFYLLDVLASHFTDYTIRIIGKYTGVKNNMTDYASFKKLIRNNNVSMEEIQPYRKLEATLLHAAACLCLYKQDGVGNRLNSLKILQYLALGRPVIATRFQEHEKNPFVYTVNSTNELLTAINTALENDTPMYRSERINFAEQYQYPVLLRQIENILTS